MSKTIKINGQLKKVQIMQGQIVLEYEDNNIGIDENIVNFPINIEEKDVKFVGKILENSEIIYKIFLFPKNKTPKDFLDLFSKLENIVPIIDYRSGQKSYARKDDKQQRISGLKNVLSRYPLLNAGDLVGVAIINNEVIIDFDFEKKIN